MSASAPPVLIGIAKLASEGHTLTQKRRVEYRSLPTRRWINRCDSRRVPFDWTVNPYRGCEYGCKYCYARYTHEFMERWDSTAFEREIYAKDWDADAFRRELRGVRRGQSIAIGTATDPYQPAERKYELTRRVLEVLANTAGRSIYLTTKSDLPVRDIDLWSKVAERNEVSIAITITTTDPVLARLLEPYRPASRSAAARHAPAFRRRAECRRHRCAGSSFDHRFGGKPGSRRFRSQESGSKTLWRERAFPEAVCTARVLSISRRAVSAPGGAL